MTLRPIRLRSAWILLASIFFASTGMTQPKIDLSEGTIYLAGGMQLQYSLLGLDKVEHQFELNSDLGGGYFLFDRFAVGLHLPVEWNLAPTSGGRFGLKISSTYFFDTGSTLFPYVGGNITPGYGLTEKSFRLQAGIDAGLLISLSESIALDLGIQPQLGFKLFNQQKWELRVPAGFLGIRAVF